MSSLNDMDKIIDLLEKATEMLKQLRRHDSIGAHKVTRIKMIDGLTGNVIRISTIREEFPSNERIEVCKKGMIGNHLVHYMYVNYVTDDEKKLRGKAFGEFKAGPYKERRKKIKDNLKWEVYQELE